MATPDDVIVFTERRTQQARADGQERHVIWFCCIVNRSAHAVRVFTPALVGPIAIPKKGFPEPMESHATPQGGEADFAVLGPNEMFGRAIFVQEGSAQDRDFNYECYYLVYAPGQEGNSKKVRAVIYADKVIPGAAQDGRD